MVDVGWLKEDESGCVYFPNADRHILQTAKTRALTNRRVARLRAKKCNDNVTIPALPTTTTTTTLKQSGVPDCPPKLAKAQKPRKANPVWDAVCSVFGLKPQTSSEQTRVGRIVRDLKIKAVTPDELQERVKRYKAAWPEIDCTPEAVLKHWDRFSEAQSDSLPIFNATLAELGTNTEPPKPVPGSPRPPPAGAYLPSKDLVEKARAAIG